MHPHTKTQVKVEALCDEGQKEEERTAVTSL